MFLCPFFRLDLVAEKADDQQAAKRKRMAEVAGPLDPFASDDEDQLKALANKFEAKYGGASAKEKIKKKKKERKLDDYADLGYGYDSDDPFIDNSDVHDELVPETVTPAHGGFYVNFGLLQFKARDSADEDSDLEAVIQEGEKAAQIQKRKYVRKRNEKSSNEKPKQQRQRKPKVTKVLTPGAKSNNDFVVVSDGSDEKKTVNKGGRPKMRKPDGTLLHPPKKPKLSSQANNGSLTITPTSSAARAAFPASNSKTVTKPNTVTVTSVPRDGTKVINITTPSQVQLKNVQTSPNSMIQDIRTQSASKAKTPASKASKSNQQQSAANSQAAKEAAYISEFLNQMAKSNINLEAKQYQELINQLMASGGAYPTSSMLAAFGLSPKADKTAKAASAKPKPASAPKPATAATAKPSTTAARPSTAPKPAPSAAAKASTPKPTTSAPKPASAAVTTKPSVAAAPKPTAKPAPSKATPAAASSSRPTSTNAVGLSSAEQAYLNDTLNQLAQAGVNLDDITKDMADQLFGDMLSRISVPSPASSPKQGSPKASPKPPTQQAKPAEKKATPAAVKKAAPPQQAKHVIPKPTSYPPSASASVNSSQPNLEKKKEALSLVSSNRGTVQAKAVPSPASIQTKKVVQAPQAPTGLAVAKNAAKPQRPLLAVSQDKPSVANASGSSSSTSPRPAAIHASSPPSKPQNTLAASTVSRPAGQVLPPRQPQTPASSMASVLSPPNVSITVAATAPQSVLMSTKPSVAPTTSHPGLGQPLKQSSVQSLSSVIEQAVSSPVVKPSPQPSLKSSPQQAPKPVQNKVQSGPFIWVTSKYIGSCWSWKN